MRIPALHCLKSKGLAFIRSRHYNGGKPYYFGPWPRTSKKCPADTEEKYKTWVREVWLKDRPAEPRPLPPSSPSIGELWELFHAYRKQRHRKNGEETSEVYLYVMACRIVARMYGSLPAAKFGAQELLNVRDEMMRLGWVRESINKAVTRVRAMFKWAAKVEQGRMIPMSVYYELQEVEGLEEGRCGDVPEGEGTDVLDMDVVEATLPHLAPAVAAMVKVQYVLMCRSQHVTPMRAGEIQRDEDRTDEERRKDPWHGAWLYLPSRDKTDHHRRKARKRGKDKQPAESAYFWIVPGPRGSRGWDAQAILLPFLEAAPLPESYLFPARPRSDSAGCYSTRSYCRHVARACAKAGLPHWSPYPLRHTRATEIGEDQGTEAAQRGLGHKHLSTTEKYAKKRMGQKLKIMLAS